MNEQIRELWQQAARADAGDDWDSQIEFLERFAQLIIKDCLRQIYYTTLMSHPEHNWSEKQIGFNEGVDTAYTRVKRHFGVE